MVIVQIQATDTLQINGVTALHTVYAQLQITVLDVNDKTPEMRMVSRWRTSNLGPPRLTNHFAREAAQLAEHG